MKQFFLLILLFIFLAPSKSIAQDSNLEGYVPPPLFSAQRAVPLKKEAVPTRDLSLPSVSRQPENLEPTIKREKTFITPRLAPSPPMKEITSEGVVKGPKVMPSNKKQDVETQETFASKKKKETLFNRSQQQKISKDGQEREIIPVSEALLNKYFETQADGTKKMVLAYENDRSALIDTEKEIIDRVIIPVFDSDKSIKLLIHAYAHSKEGVLVADRRLALSRGLAIRRYLLKHGISPYRIDVRALGAQTDIHPRDRVELYIIP